MTSRPYDAVAPFYDALANLYTQGGILRAKLEHIDSLEPGERVLYAGGGSGAEALRAARKGADVSLVEQSPKMLALCRKRFDLCEWNANLVLGDTLQTQKGAPFDVVVAPFFLNTFSKDRVGAALVSLCAHLKPGGSLVCVDFRAPSSRPLFRALQQAYYLPPLVLFYALTHNPWHGLYDYSAIAVASGAPLRLTARQSVNAWGVPLLESLTWKRT